MKTLLVLSLIFSTNAFSQATKAKSAVIPESARINQAVKNDKKAAEAPCDTKEDVLKKLEAEKKAKAAQGQGFSLQGKKDTGCSI